jgi:hypothetical protein
VELGPKAFLFRCEVLFVTGTHVFQETLLAKDLLLFKLPHPPLFLNAYELHLLLEFLLP